MKPYIKYVLVPLVALTSSVPSATAQNNTVDIEIRLEIVNSDGVGADDYTFDYNIWKMQCCKQKIIGTTSTLHYNCQALEDDMMLENCDEWVSLNE